MSKVLRELEAAEEEQPKKKVAQVIVSDMYDAERYVSRSIQRPLLRSQLGLLLTPVTLGVLCYLCLFITYIDCPRCLLQCPDRGPIGVLHWM